MDFSYSNCGDFSIFLSIPPKNGQFGGMKITRKQPNKSKKYHIILITTNETCNCKFKVISFKLGIIKACNKVIQLRTNFVKLYNEMCIDRHTYTFHYIYTHNVYT